KPQRQSRSCANDADLRAMRRKQNSLRSRGSGISISMRSNTVCVAQTDSAEAACVSHSSTTTRTRDLSVEWRNILKVYECLQLADSVDKVLSEPLERNNRIRTASCLNRNCVRGSDFESMLRVRAHKIVFQHYRSKADKPSRAQLYCPLSADFVAEVI